MIIRVFSFGFVAIVSLLFVAVFVHAQQSHLNLFNMLDSQVYSVFSHPFVRSFYFFVGLSGTLFLIPLMIIASRLVLKGYVQRLSIKLVAWIVVTSCVLSLTFSVSNLLGFKGYDAAGLIGAVLSRELSLVVENEIAFWGIQFGWLMSALFLNIWANPRLIGDALGFVTYIEQKSQTFWHHQSKVITTLINATIWLYNKIFKKLERHREGSVFVSPSITSPKIKKTKVSEEKGQSTGRVEPSVERPKASAEKKQTSLDLGNAPGNLPTTSLLTPFDEQKDDLQIPDENLQRNAELLDGVLQDFGVKGEVISVKPGPVVTLYEFEPAPGIRSQRIIGLADDIARSMGALAARVAVIPGRNAIGIELPNAHRKTVYMRELLESREYKSKGVLNIVMGKTIGGDPVAADLTKMPHLLIAGTTGSGKSVAINVMILSLLYRLKPEECRLIMVDPKMLELSVYDGIPHLLAPVVTDPKKAVMALRWVVQEMEERYKKMSKVQVRNIGGYNERMKEAEQKGEVLTRTIQTGFNPDNGEPVYEEEQLGYERLPYIVIIIDEMADLMMVAGKEVEAAVQRLAQMARAAGIHIIMATQRPSVDVITGTIKANFPTRVSFQVTTRIDSRTILDEVGAEQLLGRGDMLFRESGGRVRRLHGPFVSDEEVADVVNFLKQGAEPDYSLAITEPRDDADQGSSSIFGSNVDSDDEETNLFNRAVDIVARDRKASTSYIQRKLSIGYNRAARIIEQMEDEGIVGPANHVGKREILVRNPEE